MRESWENCRARLATDLRGAAEGVDGEAGVGAGVGVADPEGEDAEEEGCGPRFEAIRDKARAAIEKPRVGAFPDCGILVAEGVDACGTGAGWAVDEEEEPDKVVERLKEAEEVGESIEARPVGKRETFERRETEERLLEAGAGAAAKAGADAGAGA